jgi:hypothetical protein
LTVQLRARTREETIVRNPERSRHTQGVKLKGGNPMNTTQTRISRIWLSAVALALLVGLTPATAETERRDRGCSAASLKGFYGLYRTGTAPYGAVAAQGLIFFDGEGGWGMTLNISRGGEIFVDEGWGGGYSVGPDCTGEIDGGASIVIADDGKTVYLLSLLGGGFNMYEVWTRIHNGRGDRDETRHNPGCSLRSLDGTYGLYRIGRGPFGAVTGQGIGFFDGEGNWNARVNNVREGEASLNEEYAGTYAVEPNCAGAFFSEDGAEIERFVLVDDGKGIYLVNLIEGVAVVTVGTRIHNGRGGNHDR